MRWLWNVLRVLALAVLTLGALASLALALISLYDVRRNFGWVTADNSIIESLDLELDYWVNRPSVERIGVRAEHAGLSLSYSWTDRSIPPNGPLMSYFGPSTFLLPGISRTVIPSSSGSRTEWLDVSYWYFFVLFGFWPLLSLVRHRIRRRRRRAGTCRGCGYNLTGNVNGVCPECGQLAAAYHEPT